MKRLGADRRTRKLQERAYEKMLERNRGLEDDWEGDRLAAETEQALLEDDEPGDLRTWWEMYGPPEHANCRCTLVPVKANGEP